MYSGKSSVFVLSGFFLISPLSCFLLSVVSVALVLLDLNCMSSCFIVQFPEHLVNLIVPFFQLTSRLCLTSQSCPRNMSVPSKFITATSRVSLCLLISTSRDATLVTSPFFVLSVLNTSKEKFISLVWILLSLTNCSSIPVFVHPESTIAFTFNFLPFFVLTFTCTFNFFFPLLVQWFGIMYLLFWEFTWEISCTMPTWDLHQNPICSGCLHHLFPFIIFGNIPLLVTFKTCSCFLFLFFLIGILLPYVHTCCNWSTWASHLWNYH